MSANLLERIADGRTDFLFEYVAAGNPVSTDRGGTGQRGMEGHLLGRPR